MLAAAVVTVRWLSPTSSPTGAVPEEAIGWLLAFAVLVLALFRFRGMYVPPLRLEVTETVRLVATGTALAAVLGMVPRVLFVDDSYVAAETVRHWLVAVPFLVAGRALVLWSERHARRSLGAAQRTLVIGAGSVGRAAARRLLDDATLGLRPVAFLDGDPLDLDEPTPPLPVYGWDQLERAVDDHAAEHAIVAFSRADHERLLGLIRACWARRLSVSIVPRLFELKSTRVGIEHLGGLSLVHLDPPKPHGWQFRLKHAVDRVAAAGLLVLLAPVTLSAMLAVRLSLGSPILYRQLRVGRDGRVFWMQKFRTLRAPAWGEGEGDADWASDELGEAPVEAPLEERMTRVGATLRRTAIDELPQLWNVVRGDMSLVGPRPERPSYATRFASHIYRYDDRHRVKSGLTGWAQIHGLRGKTSLRERVEYDNYYIENWSPWLDLKILLRTLALVLTATYHETRGTWPEQTPSKPEEAPSAPAPHSAELAASHPGGDTRLE